MRIDGPQEKMLPHLSFHLQVNELCEAANKEVGQEEGVRIANFLCNGNYAVSGGLPGCEVGCLILLPGLWQQVLSRCQHFAF